MLLERHSRAASNVKTFANDTYFNVARVILGAGLILQIVRNGFLRGFEGIIHLEISSIAVHDIDGLAGVQSIRPDARTSAGQRSKQRQEFFAAGGDALSRQNGDQG